MLTAQTRARMKTVALPAEHGSWAFLLEPILLGLLVAPSAPGLFLAVAGAGMFLLHHPLRLAWGDWRRGLRAPRTRLATRFVVFYGALAVVGLWAALSLASPAILLPLLLAFPPVAILMLIYDALARRRALLIELAGPVALGALAPAIALAAGWAGAPALGLWAILVARSVPSILYIRARLRLERGQSVRLAPPVAVHLGFLIALGLMAWVGLAPALTAVAEAVLLLRAARGLSARRESPIRPQKLGFLEVGYGLVTVLIVAFGYWAGL